MKTAEYIIESLMPCRGIQSRSKMVREGKLGIPQNHSSEHRISDEEQKMTIALIYISLIAAITALLTLLHYSLKSVFMAKNYHDKLSIADGVTKAWTRTTRVSPKWTRLNTIWLTSTRKVLRVVFPMSLGSRMMTIFKQHLPTSSERRRRKGNQV